MSDTAPRGSATISVAAPSTAPAGEPRFLFWWVAIVGVLLTLGAVGVLTYLRCRSPSATDAPRCPLPRWNLSTISPP